MSCDDVKKMAALKARLPNVKCKGWCWRECTSIHMTTLERELIEERHGIHMKQAPPGLILSVKGKAPCPALKDRRCTIHEDKEAYPLICSAFGATDHMPCFYGCEVEGEPMPLEEYKLLDADVNDIGKSPFQTPMDRTRLRQLLSTRSGRKRFREHCFRELEAYPYKWWRAYVKRFPEGEPEPKEKPE